MTDKALVHVVHCVDTEGPMDESIEATFDRLRSTFGLDLTPSLELLEKLRHGEGVPETIRGPVAKMLDPHLYSFRRNWAEIDEMLDRVIDNKCRTWLPDSLGGGWVFSWFCLDHVGYEFNPRQRDLGHHKVWDHYRARIEAQPNCRDLLQFHYHPMPWNKMAHSCATSYLQTSHLFEILARKILERDWFPSVYRPGFHVVRPDSHWFLEQWFPFDFSNQSTDQETDQPDLADGRFGDWRRATRSWKGYHPDPRDWQIPGSCRRRTFRCLNLESRLRRLRQQDVFDAFEEAAQTGSTVLAFTSHDFRDMEPEIHAVQAMLKNVSSHFSQVDFEYTDALTAARHQARVESIQAPNLRVTWEGASSSTKLTISVDRELFGIQPFLAIETESGQFLHDNLDFTENSRAWTYTFDWQTITTDRVRQVGIAATSKDGAVEILRTHPNHQEMSRRIHHV